MPGRRRRRSPPRPSDSEYADGHGKVAMAETMIGRIRPGASVDWADGHLGRIVNVEQGTGGDPGRIEVLADDSGRTLFVPPDLVDAVDRDGTVRLTVSRAE